MPDDFPSRSANRRTLLVVDDEPQVLLLRALLAGDFDVLSASDGCEAQALFGQRAIDIILTDQRLPGWPAPNSWSGRARTRRRACAC
jgi:CheY-like chemotaxis protein